MKRPSRWTRGRRGRGSCLTEWPERLRMLGYTPDGQRRGVNPAKHLLHIFGNVPALDAEAVSLWHRAGNVATVTVFRTDHKTMTAALTDILKSGKRISFGSHGEQIVIRTWRIDDGSQLALL